MDTPQIYVACVASYNEGILHGCWINAMQGKATIMLKIQRMLDNSHVEDAEDYAILDYQHFGAIKIDEYQSIDSITAYVDFMSRHGELGAKLIQLYGIDEAEELINDYYYGCYDSEVDFAWQLFEEYFIHQWPENLIYYFDCEAFARDLFINAYFSVNIDGNVHIFSYH